jgi:hypothetical protein
MGKRVSHVMLTELVLENRETPSLLTLDADWVLTSKQAVSPVVPPL